MVWEIVIGVILVMGILTTVREIRLKKARKKTGKEHIISRQ
jgi:hypothetical protein